MWNISGFKVFRVLVIWSDLKDTSRIPGILKDSLSKMNQPLNFQKRKDLFLYFLIAAKHNSPKSLTRNFPATANSSIMSTSFEDNFPV